jgi:hypothetical protein
MAAGDQVTLGSGSTGVVDGNSARVTIGTNGSLIFEGYHNIVTAGSGSSVSDSTVDGYNTIDATNVRIDFAELGAVGTVFGNGNTIQEGFGENDITVSGSNNTVTAFDYNNTTNIASGTGNIVDLVSHDTVNVDANVDAKIQYGVDSIINLGANDIVLVNGDQNTIHASNDIIDIASSETITIIGSHDTIVGPNAVSGTPTITVDGSYDHAYTIYSHVDFSGAGDTDQGSDDVVVGGNYDPNDGSYGGFIGGGYYSDDFGDQSTSARRARAAATSGSNAKPTRTIAEISGPSSVQESSPILSAAAWDQNSLRAPTGGGAARLRGSTMSATTNNDVDQLVQALATFPVYSSTDPLSWSTEQVEPGTPRLVALWEERRNHLSAGTHIAA